MFLLNPVELDENNQEKETLHSTMFLLNQYAVDAEKYRDNPLHSTMFLLNHLLHGTL